MTRNSAVDEHLLLGENFANEAILPPSDTGSAPSSSFPLDWRQMIGGLLLAAGLIAVIAAVVGATGAATTGDQLSYIASGGLGGAGLIALGILFVVMHEHAQDRAALAALTTHMVSLEEDMHRILDEGVRK